MVSLEISSKETGVFDIKASSFGIKKTQEILLQDLLQKQYDGEEAPLSPTVNSQGFRYPNHADVRFLHRQCQPAGVSHQQEVLQQVVQKAKSKSIGYFTTSKYHYDYSVCAVDGFLSCRTTFQIQR